MKTGEIGGFVVRLRTFGEDLGVSSVERSVEPRELSRTERRFPNSSQLTEKVYNIDNSPP